jgi:hypothetical protein
MDDEQLRGLRAAVVAYVTWGLLTLYWKQLSGPSDRPHRWCRFTDVLVDAGDGDGDPELSAAGEASQKEWWPVSTWARPPVRVDRSRRLTPTTYER